MEYLQYDKNRDGPQLEDWRARSLVRDYFPQFREKFPDFQARKILEIGCGKGRLITAGLREGLDIYGIDIRRSIYERDKKRFIQADIRSMPFKDESFDLVFEHLALDDMAELQDLPMSEMDKAIKEIYRILTPKGFIFNFHCRFPYKHLTIDLFKQMVIPDQIVDSLYQKIASQNP